MKKEAVAVCLALLLGGCAQVTTGIRMHQNTLTANQCHASLPIQQLKQEFKSGTIRLTRTYYQADNNALLIHEKGSLDPAYEFMVGPVSLMQAGFEFRSYRVHDAGDYHDLLEGVDRYGEKVYVLVGSIGAANDFELFYSHAKELITPLLPCVASKEPSSLSLSPASAPLSLHVKHPVVTDWGVRMLFTHEVISRKFLRFYLTH